MFFTVITIVLIGIVAIFSAGYGIPGKKFLWQKQLIWFTFALIVFFFSSQTNYRVFIDYSDFIFWTVVVLLILTLIIGVRVRGAKSWLITSPFSIQVSEFAKVAVIIKLARELTEREWNFRKYLRIAVTVGLPLLLIIAQPDFGTALTFIPFSLAMLFVAEIPSHHLFIILGAGLLSVSFPILFTYYDFSKLPEALNSTVAALKIALPSILIISVLILLILGILHISFNIFRKRFFKYLAAILTTIAIGSSTSLIATKMLKTYQKKRLLVFINPSFDPLGVGYNIIQSKIAIGSGGILGRGFLKGTQGRLGFLPEQATDFIFSHFAEEFGMIGTVVIFTLYTLLILKIFKTAASIAEPSAKLLSAGIGTLLSTHFILNVGMATGVFPVTGLPLLGMSYGGSALTSFLWSMGIINSISVRRYMF